jgi:hypothetical protein
MTMTAHTEAPLREALVASKVDSRLRPIAVNPNEVFDEEFIYVDNITDHILLQIGDKKVHLTKLGAKELAVRLIEHV